MPAWKRAADLVLVGLALPFVLVVAVLACVWIRLVSPGSVLYRQTRVGKGGRCFTIYKFRSMHATAGTKTHEDHVRSLIRTNQPMTKLDHLGDTRLIRGGCFLRMSGIDELPQLLNVIRGEMSLVGPRPCLPKELEYYGDANLRRFSVEPGLTGCWQVERTASTTFRQMLAMDESYIRRRGLGNDLSIMFRTPVAVARQFGASLGPVLRRRRRPARGAANFGTVRQPTHAARKHD